ncbi:phosphatase PAP2 family protein [Candidatus Kaiserbacteria bacterium]|nr:phosphatase PAP2 family protein [Candidatus Kaiserbacteria bacterium]
MMNVDGAAFFFLYGFSGHSQTVDSLLVFLSIYLPIILVVAAIFYMVLAAYPRREKEAAFISGLLSVALSRVAAGETIRFFLPRERPMFAMHLQPLFPEDSSSFPSGHALALFAVGGMLYAYNKKAGVLFNVLALAVCIARVASGVHYPSDILAGALIGSGCAWLVWQYATPYIRSRLQTLTQ